jgi:hypothetical protein
MPSLAFQCGLLISRELGGLGGLGFYVCVCLDGILIYDVCLLSRLINHPLLLFTVTNRHYFNTISSINLLIIGILLVFLT